MNLKGCDMNKGLAKMAFLSTILCLAFFVAARSGAYDSLLVRYIPFDVETYSPVTPNNINESTVCVYGGVPEKTLQSMRELIDLAGEGRFDDARVRVKLEEFDGSDVYIDADGGILIEPASTIRKLSESNFAALKGLFSVIDRRNCYFGPRQWPVTSSDYGSAASSK